MRWVERYERAWRSPGTDQLGELFTRDVVYFYTPYDEPLRGLDSLSAWWDGERAGPDEEFTLWAEPVAVEQGTGVARVHVDYYEPIERSYRDLWIVVTDDDGLCRHFEEWPFFPGQPRGVDLPQR